MTKINLSESPTLEAPAHDEAKGADVAGKTELVNKENINGTAHTIVGKAFDHTKEAVEGAKGLVNEAKEAMAQGEPHVAFSASS